MVCKSGRVRMSLMKHRYILVSIIVGAILVFLLWWLLNEPMPQTVPERSIKI